MKTRLTVQSCLYVLCVRIQAWSPSPSELFQPPPDLHPGGVAWWVTSWLLRLEWTPQPKPSVCLSSTSTTSCFQVLQTGQGSHAHSHLMTFKCLSLKLIISCINDECLPFPCAPLRSAPPIWDDSGPAPDSPVRPQTSTGLPVHQPDRQTGLQGHLRPGPLKNRLLQEAAHGERYHQQL